MRKSSERTFYHFTCHIRAKSQKATVPTMDTLVQVWEQAWLQDKAITELKDDSGTLAVGDLVHNEENGYVAILIRHSDKSAPNTVYSDIAAKKFTEHKKGAGEGHESGIHLLISTIPEAEKPNVYACLVEGCEGLGYSSARRVLNDILRERYKVDSSIFEFLDPAGQKDRQGKIKVRTCQPRIDLFGEPSQDFVHDLEAGTLQGVTLINTNLQQSVAGVPWLSYSEDTLKLTIDKKSVPLNFWDDLKRALKSKSKQYGKAKVSYKLPDRTRSVSVDLNSKTGAPLKELYIKSTTIKSIFPLLANSSVKVVPHLQGLAANILFDSRSLLDAVEEESD
jgi:hypothetical protein